MDDKIRDDYDSYLEQHISNVKRGFEWMVENIPEIFSGYDSENIADMVINHDQSKYDDEEYFAYAEYFYGTKTEEVKNSFDFAWLHHQHHNPHHWQHWLLRQDDGSVKPLAMPYENVIEMIADWWAFSWNKNNLFEIFDWYDNNKSKMEMHSGTKQQVEDILSKLKNTLEEKSYGNEE